MRESERERGKGERKRVRYGGKEIGKERRRERHDHRRELLSE